MAFLDRIRALNNHRPGDFVPWFVGGRRVGRLRPALAAALLRRGGTFVPRDAGVALDQALADFDSRSAALAEAVGTLVVEGWVSHVHGEPYPVTAGCREEALCVLDRAAAAQFGIRAFGQHLNGYVRREDGLHLWIGRRAADRLHWPGRLDNLVAGGLPHGITLADNLAKECAEEAGMPGELARAARPASVVTYAHVTAQGFKPDVLYCYDLELPADFAPRCTDGEVAAFHLWPVEEVARRVADTEEFKPNCNLVVLDFLVRHGVVGPDHPEYLDIVSGLHPALDPPM
jgi:isopentenyldiphosphate isomerase